MTIGDNTEANILKLVFNATAWANVADNAGASPLTQIAVALHTADPADAGTQATSEAAYGGYARQNVNRNSGGWLFSGPTPSQVTLVANLDFPASTGSAATLTNFSAGKTGGGTTDIYWTGAISPTIPIGASGVIPRLTTASNIQLD